MLPTFGLQSRCLDANHLLSPQKAITKVRQQANMDLSTSGGEVSPFVVDGDIQAA